MIIAINIFLSLLSLGNGMFHYKRKNYKATTFSFFAFGFSLATALSYIIN